MDRCLVRGSSSNTNHNMVYRNMAMDKFRPRMDVTKVLMILLVLLNLIDIIILGHEHTELLLQYKAL